METNEIKEKVCESNIKSFSGSGAAEYDKEHDSAYREKIFWDNLKKITKDLDGGNIKILDIACGTGKTTQILFKYLKKSKIVCLDISKDMLEVFKKKLNPEEKKRAKFICCDATEYFKKCKEKFDMIIVRGSLHHIFDYLNLLDLSSKRLKEGGVYYIADEPLPKQEYNYYFVEAIRILDRATYEYKIKKINGAKLFLYLLYAPFNFTSPIINSRYIRKFKDKIMHKEEVERNLSEYWGYKKGLDLNEILRMFRENDIKIISLKIGSEFKQEWADKLIQFLRMRSSFGLIGVKTK